MRPRGTGFTLVEMLIVMALVALLAAIALPSYRSQVMKGNRATAKAALTNLVSLQESFFADRRAYATTLTALGFPDPLYLCNDGALTCTATSGIYQLTFTTATATAYTVNAAPINSQAADKCGTFSITSIGVRTQSGTLGSLCWKS